VPFLHTGQKALAPTNNALRAFLFVGVAYFLAAAAVLAYAVLAKAEPMQFNARGMTLSTFAGLLGALGALGVAFALMHGGRPIVVAPLVFAGAPIVNTLVSLIWHRPEKAPHPFFYVGIVVAAVGASMVLRFKPA
jgi:hypothetical protein